MCWFNDIQSNDYILIRGSTFIHAYCTIYFGENNNTLNNTLSNNNDNNNNRYSLIVENCLFIQIIQQIRQFIYKILILIQIQI